MSKVVMENATIIFKRKFLNALVRAGGQIMIQELRSLYMSWGDAQRVAMLIRHGLAEYVRREGGPSMDAVGIRITDAGRADLNHQATSEVLTRETKTCLDETGLKITSALYKAVASVTSDPCLLAMIGSWGDTLDDEFILEGLHRYNEMGECFIPDHSVFTPTPTGR